MDADTPGTVDQELLMEASLGNAGAHRKLIEILQRQGTRQATPNTTNAPKRRTEVSPAVTPVKNSPKLIKINLGEPLMKIALSGNIKVLLRLIELAARVKLAKDLRIPEIPKDAHLNN